MRLSEIAYAGAQPVDGYGPGFFRIGGEIWRGPVLTGPGGTGSWGGLDDPAAAAGLADGIDLLILGTGAVIAHPPPDFRAALERAAIAVEPMASPAACRTYNVLLSEGRRVAAALIPV